MCTARILGVLLLTFMAVACKRERPQPSTNPFGTPFREAVATGEVTPLANGDAYLKSPFGRIFYVSGGLAQQVQGLPADAQRELTPLADGSALLASSFVASPELYWLRTTQAVRVVEAPTSASIGPVTREGLWFAETQHLRRELAAATTRASDAEDVGDDQDDREYQ